MNVSDKNLDPANINRLETASEWLMRIHSDSLTEAETAGWIQWCESDPENLAAFEQMEAVWSGLGLVSAARSPELASGTASATTAAAKPKLAARARFNKWLGFPLMRPALAAGMVVLTVLGVILWHVLAIPTMPTIATGLETPIGKNEDAKLPDGSVLTLGAKSSVSLDFAPDERKLLMKEGQAFFQVAPDRKRPFIVDTGPIQVKAIGTAFDIRKNDDRIVVSVTEGTVEILPGTHGARLDDTGETHVQVAAGYQLTWSGPASEVKLAQIDAASATAWRRGRLEYFGEPLGVVIANVNRYSQRTIVIADEDIAQLQFTGTVFVHSIEDWTNALKDVFPVVSESQADGSLVLKRRTSP